MSWFGTSTIAAGATVYAPPGGFGSSVTPEKELFIWSGSSAATFSRMNVYIQTAQPGDAAMTVNFTKCTPSSGICTLATCSIQVVVAASAPAGAQTPDNTHTCTVNPGDLYSYQIINASGSPSAFLVNISTLYK
jgi:hypothetical protein